MVEYLPSMRNALSLNPNGANTKQTIQYTHIAMNIAGIHFRQQVFRIESVSEDV